jgi:hypothetical protein
MCLTLGEAHDTPLPGRSTLEDTLSGMPDFLAHRIEATSRVASILMS